MSDYYYVCGECGHYWSEPEQPVRCESCSRMASLARFRSLDDAEEASEAIYAPIREMERVAKVAARIRGESVPNWQRRGFLNAQKPTNDEHSFGL